MTSIMTQSRLEFKDKAHTQEHDMAALELLVATKNTHKIKEFAAILDGFLPGEVTMTSLGDLAQVPDVVEDRDTFHGNAIKKAVELSAFAQKSVMSEDSGLEVDALGGAPGVHSARYAGLTPRSDAANNHKLIDALAAHPSPYTARYVAVTCLALGLDDPMGQWFAARLGVQSLDDVPAGEPAQAGELGRVGDRVVVWWRGECEGEIARAPQGDGGFGYDPLFYVAALGRTLAQVTLEQKSAISHRRHALEAMREAMT
jgi:XTP/dITP diphosphohydrolase